MALAGLPFLTPEDGVEVEVQIPVNLPAGPTFAGTDDGGFSGCPDNASCATSTTDLTVLVPESIGNTPSARAPQREGLGEQRSDSRAVAHGFYREQKRRMTNRPWGPQSSTALTASPLGAAMQALERGELSVARISTSLDGVATGIP